MPRRASQWTSTQQDPLQLAESDRHGTASVLPQGDQDSFKRKTLTNDGWVDIFSEAPQSGRRGK